jgi:hypothetical protein
VRGLQADEKAAEGVPVRQGGLVPDVPTYVGDERARTDPAECDPDHNRLAG